MSNVKKLVTPGGAIVDIVLSLLWFSFFTVALRWYVPVQVTGDHYELYRWGFAAFTAACMTGVFWIAVGMFRVVRVDYQHRKQQGL